MRVYWLAKRTLLHQPEKKKKKEKRIHSTFPTNLQQQINSGKVNNHIFCEQISILSSRYLVRGPFWVVSYSREKKKKNWLYRENVAQSSFFLPYSSSIVMCPVWPGSSRWAAESGRKERKKKVVSCSTCLFWKGVTIFLCGKKCGGNEEKKKLSLYHGPIYIYTYMSDSKWSEDFLGICERPPCLTHGGGKEEEEEEKV